MKVNFNTVCTDWQGNPLRTFEDKNDKVGKPVVLADKLKEILYSYGIMGQVSNEKKYDAYKVFKKLERGEQDFAVEELTLIKEVAGQALVAGVAGQLYDLIEQAGCKTNSK